MQTSEARQVEPTPLRLALPKGRMQEKIFDLMREAGVEVRVSSRGYRPHVSLEGLDVKILKPQNVIEMLHAGSRDVGFAGADWVKELDADLVELLDTGFDPVKLVAAAPTELLVEGQLPKREIVVTSEYQSLTKQWIAAKGLKARFVRSYGATEVFPPEDADCIVDITQTGDTLRANGLAIFDEMMSSSTRLYASPGAMKNPEKKAAIERLVMLLKSVLEARGRVMVEVNVPPEKLEAVIGILPCMREPTVATLHGGMGYAIKSAVPRAQLPLLIPRIKEAGGTDIVVFQLSQIIP